MRYKAHQHSLLVQVYAIVALGIAVVALVLGQREVLGLVALLSLVVLYGGRQDWF